MKVIRVEIDETIVRNGRRLPFRVGGFSTLFSGTRVFEYVTSPLQHGWKFSDETIFAFISLEAFIKCVRYALEDDQYGFMWYAKEKGAVVVEYDTVPMFTDHVQAAFNWHNAVKISEVPLIEVIEKFRESPTVGRSVMC